jgi:hypothetical protein
LALVDDPAERERRALQYRSPPESILAVLDHLDARGMAGSPPICVLAA